MNRFWDKVLFTLNGCWDWQGGTTRGYGMFWLDSAMVKAHRVAFVLFYGITLECIEGLKLLHHCSRTCCVNPTHLYIGTQQDNMTDACLAGVMARKLTEDDIINMRQEYASGVLNQYELAAKYGVGQPKISEIINNKFWRHVKEPLTL